VTLPAARPVKTPAASNPPTVSSLLCQVTWSLTLRSKPTS
jgi:hypothetical protein